MVSIILAVAALLLVSMLPGAEFGNQGDKQAITIERMQAIEDATRAFMAANERRPCPANGTLPITDPKFGLEGFPLGICAYVNYANFKNYVSFTANVTNGSPVLTNVSSTVGLFVGLVVTTGNLPTAATIVSIDSPTQVTVNVNATATSGSNIVYTYTMAGGTVPTKTLGLPNEYGFDGWGRRIMYAVDAKATTPASCYHLQSQHTDNGSIGIYGHTGNAALDQVMWGLVSYGTDSNGAFSMEGSASVMSATTTDTDELTNVTAFSNGSSRMDGNLIRKEPTSTYHDVIWYRDTTKDICCWGSQFVKFTPPADNTYSTGQVLTFTLTYNEPVTVQGTPRLKLTALGGGANTIGTSNVAYANYVSGSGSMSLTFTYTVLSTDVAAAGISTTSPIDLNGGSVSPCARFFNLPDMSKVIIGAVVTPGFLYVADTNNSRIQKFDLAGNYISQWGSYGSGNGQFNYPENLAADASGNVWVADMYISRVQEFDGNGNYIRQFGSPGSGNGQLNGPWDVAIDFGGNVLVVDAGNARVEKFDSTGNYLSQFGSAGTGNGQFTSMSGIAVDSSGNIWVTDMDLTHSNARIQIFNSSGTYLSQFGSFGFSPGQLYWPSGLAFDASGNAWIADIVSDQVSKFDNSGSYISRFLASGATAYGAYADAIDSSGNIWVVDAYNQRVAKFNSSGTQIGQIGCAGTGACSIGAGNGQFQYPQGVAIYTPPTPPFIYVADEGGNRVEKFDSTGRFISQIGCASGACAPNYGGAGGFYDPIGVMVDALGNVFVTDMGNNRVEEFDSSGNYLSQFGSTGSGNGQFVVPTNITPDTSGNIWVNDPGNARLQKFDGNGNYLMQFAEQANGFTLDGSGNIWVLDNGAGNVKKFDSTGNYLSQFGSIGLGAGQFAGTFSIVIDASGNILVSDNAGRVQKFDNTGNYLSFFGSSGSGNGQFNAPMSIAIDSGHNFWVSDTYNHRVQEFDSNGVYLRQFGSQGAGAGQFAFWGPQGIAIGNQ
jgi:sugar lactone lactonase YvrE